MYTWYIHMARKCNSNGGRKYWGVRTALYVRVSVPNVGGDMRRAHGCGEVRARARACVCGAYARACVFVCVLGWGGMMV